MYKKLIDPSEKEINNMLNNNYYLHSISVIPAYSIFEPKLVYHFIQDKNIFKEFNKSFEKVKEVTKNYNLNDLNTEL